AKHADGVHDLLLSLGDLSADEIEARCAPRESADEWIRELETARRIARVKMAGAVRFVASEDIGRYRDALGIVPPRGMASAFLEPVKDPMGDLVSRFARTHGPFLPREVASRFGVGLEAVEQVIDR